MKQVLTTGVKFLAKSEIAFETKPINFEWIPIYYHY